MTDADNTATALDLLDARGRQAAASLRSAVDDLMADAPPVPLDSVVVDLRETPRHGPARRVWLIAAAVMVVAGVVTAIVFRLTGDEQTMVSNDTPSYLVPRTVPDGWDLQEARVVHASDFSSAMDVTITVYGDSGRDDPWSGPLLTIYENGAVVVDRDGGGEAIEIGGQPATVSEVDGDVDVQVASDDRSYTVIGQAGIDRAEVIAAAEGLVAGDVDGRLPERLERLAQGPGSVAAPYSSFAFDGLSLVYGGASSSEGQIVVVQQAGEADDVELVRITGAAEAVEVDGHPAYSVEDTVLTWFDPGSGTVVTVMGLDLEGSVVRAFAEGLAPGRPGEVDDLVEAHSSSAPFGPLQPGEVVAIESPAGERQWQLVASDDGDTWSLTFADPGGSSGMGVTAGDENWNTLSVSMAQHADATADDEVGIYGAVTSDAAEVVIEAPGHDPIHLDVHPVTGIDGWEANVFAGLVPPDMASGFAVALSADGTELARESIDGDNPSVAGGATTEEEAPSVEASSDG